MLSFSSSISATATVVEDFEIREYGLVDRYSPDGWLEGRSDEGEPDLPPSWGPYDQGDWHRVRHSIRAAAKVIEAEANRVAPGFVTRQGTIGIEILPLSVWGGGLPRVRATFTEPGQETRDLKVVGAGTARWVAAAVRLACRRLQAGRQMVTDDVGSPVEDEAEKRRIVRQARSAPFTQQAVHLEPSDAPAVYVADEPEAHLHPAALQSVRQWLTKLAETASTVLVATHSTALLDSTSELVHRVLVLRTEEGTQLRRMTGALGDELGRVSDQLGLTRGEDLAGTTDADEQAAIDSGLIQANRIQYVGRRGDSTQGHSMPGPVPPSAPRVRQTWRAGFPGTPAGHHSRIGSRAAYWPRARPGGRPAVPPDAAGGEVAGTALRLDARHASRR